MGVRKGNLGPEPKGFCDALAAAAVGRVRRELDHGRKQEARSLAHALADSPATEVIGNVCAALVAYAEGFLPLSYDLLRKVPPALAIKLAPIEFLRAAAATDRDLVPKWIEEIRDTADAASKKTLLSAIQLAIELGLIPLADDLAQAIQADQEQLLQLPLYQRLEFALRSFDDYPQSAFSAESTHVSILDARPWPHSDRYSDLSVMCMLSQLARHAKITPYEHRLPKPLSRFLTLTASLCSGRGEPKLGISMLAPIALPEHRGPQSTWILVDGLVDTALLQRLARSDDRCILVSVRAAGPLEGTEQVIQWLRRREPIGCTDWSTILLFEQLGIRAFFAGSSLLTVASIDDALRQLKNDTEKPSSTRFHSAARRHCRASRDQAAPTRSLDCYIHRRALGLDARAHPSIQLQVEGYDDLTDREIARLTERFEARLYDISRAIASAGTTEDVLQVWRETCAEDYRLSRAYHAARLPAHPPSIELTPRLQQIRCPQPTNQPCGVVAIELAFAVDRALSKHLPAVLESIAANTSQSVRVHLLGRGLPADFLSQLRRDFDRIRFDYYDCSSFAYSPEIRLLNHTTESTLDRLLLPELLKHLDRVIYLDVDLVVLGDLWELWSIDLNGTRLAAKSSSSPNARWAHQMIEQALARQPIESARGARRYLYENFKMACRAFNAGVLVLNLKRMRSESFTNRFLGIAERFGMNDQDVLNLYAENDRLELPAEWNAIARQDCTEGAKIIHFAGPVKPWSRLYIRRAYEFTAYRERYLDRTGRSA